MTEHSSIVFNAFSLLLSSFHDGMNPRLSSEEQ